MTKKKATVLNDLVFAVGSEKMPRASLPWGMPGKIRPSAYPELLRMDIHFSIP